MKDEQFEKNIDDVEDFEEYKDLFGIIDDEEYDENGNLKELDF